MQHLLDNPVFNSLNLNDQHLGSGTLNVKLFDQEVSPFAGINDDYENGFDELFQLVPNSRIILYATPQNILLPACWKLIDKIEGLQMIFTQQSNEVPEYKFPKPLGKKDIEQMVSLAALTKPGPFGPRTIEFGHYHGIFDGEKLVAMAGQRLHVQNYTEISAVCTHPDYLGKGYAANLVGHQIQLILSKNQIPFLHVRDDNKRAIELYQRLGFQTRSPMNFYVLKKSE